MDRRNLNFDPIQHALNEIELTYGVKVSLKRKSLNKFGSNNNIDTGQIVELQRFQGATQYEETLATSNSIDSASSSSGADVGELYIEGHYEGPAGLYFKTQTITLQGQTRVPLDQSLIRVSRARAANGANFTGNIAIYENTALTTGLPTDVTKTHLYIPSGTNTSYKAMTSFSHEDFGIITGGFADIKRSSGANTQADLIMQVKPYNQSGWFAVGELSLSSAATSALYRPFNPFPVVPNNYDIRVIADTDTNDTNCSAAFDAYLAIKGR